MQSTSNEISFKGQKIYVGIDVHLKSWKVTIMVGQTYYKTFSQPSDAGVLGRYLRKHFPGGEYYSAYEAGFTGFSTHRNLEKEGIRNIVVNPADIPTTDKERKQKEDQRDSRKIAKTLSAGSLKAIYIPDLAQEELRSLVRYRRTLVGDISRNKNRIKSALYFHGISIPAELETCSKYWSGNFTRWLEKVRLNTDFGHLPIEKLLQTTTELRQHLLSVNRELRRLSQSDMYKDMIAYLQSVPGVGLVVSMTLLSELGDIMRFKNIDRLCSYIGLVPTTSSSGENERSGGLTPRSNRIIRGYLVESAWVAIRIDPALLLSYNKLCERMKPSRAIIRIARKLVARIRFVMKNETFYKCSVV